jgi:hypothetical protein
LRILGKGFRSMRMLSMNGELDDVRDAGLELPLSVAL